MPHLDRVVSLGLRIVYETYGIIPREPKPNSILERPLC